MIRLSTILIALTVALIALAATPTTGQGQEGADSKPKAKAPIWYDINATPTEITWLVQSAYGPSMLIEEDRKFQIGSNTFTIREHENDQPEVKALELHIDTETEQVITIPAEDTTIKFTLGGKERSLLIARDALDRRFFVPNSALAVSPKRKSMLIVDANLNGVFGDELVDWVIWGKEARFALAYSKRMSLTDGDYHFEIKPGEKKTQLRYRFIPTTLKGGAKELQTTLNTLRLNFGLFPTEANQEWNGYCLDHAKYMKKNNLFTHHEVKGNEGYTTKGHIAGTSSILTKGTMSATHAVFSLWDTPLHGFDIRSPFFSQAAYAHVKPYSVIRSMGLTHRPFAFGQSWSFPPNNSINIPIEWPGKESPDPRVDTKRGIGYPITFSTLWGVTNFSQEDALKGENTRKLKRVSRPRIHSAAAKLSAFVNGEWKDVEIQHTYNSKTAPKSLQGRAWVYHYILPQDKLAKHTLHKVTLDWEDLERKAYNYTFCFTTGEDRAGHKWDTKQPRFAPKRKKRR